jgi:hypothetical protein
MRVSLGTIEVPDEVRKAIRKTNGGKGDATRGEVKDWALEQLQNSFDSAVTGEVPAPAPAAEVEPGPTFSS